MAEMDVESLDALDNYVKYTTALRLKSIGRKPDIMDIMEITHGFIGHILTLERLAIIYQDAEDYKTSIMYYKMMRNRLVWNKREKKEIERIDRKIAFLEKKISNENPKN